MCPSGHPSQMGCYQGDGAADGCGAARLRAGGQRYEFPRPSRLPGGHRRYTEADAEAIKRALAEHTSGLALPAAFVCAREARREEPPAPCSRRCDGGIQRQPGSALEANAGCPQPRIEGEAAARAERGLHVGCFQRRRFYQESKRRFRPRAPTGWCAGRGAASANRPGDVRMGARLSLSRRASPPVWSPVSCPGRSLGPTWSASRDDLESCPNVARQVLGLAVASARGGRTEAGRGVGARADDASPGAHGRPRVAAGAHQSRDRVSEPRLSPPPVSVQAA